MPRKRFQQGQLWLHKTQAEGARWYLRYRDAAGRKRLHVLGTQEELKTKADARQRASVFLAPLNEYKLQRRQPWLMAELLERYEREELPQRRATRNGYESMLRRWIRPRWQGVPLGEVRAAQVELWLRGLLRENGTPPAKKTKANIRQLMHVLFECGRRWEMVGENPIALVRQSAARSRKLPRLSVEQYRRLCGALLEPHRTMVLLAGCLGLRVGEILGLQWGDVDLEGASVVLQRDVYQARVDELKTDAAHRQMPLPEVVVESLRVWSQNAERTRPGDFVFGNANGQPLWADWLRVSVLQATAGRLGLPKIGWHSFRHLFAAGLQVVGTEQIVQQELMGHADYRTTARYQYGFEERKRQAAEAVAGLLLREN